jgi:hypothetical protein
MFKTPYEESPAALPSCAGPIWVVALGLVLGAPVGLRLLPATGPGPVATLALAFVAPGLPVSLGLGLEPAVPALTLKALGPDLSLVVGLAFALGLGVAVLPLVGTFIESVLAATLGGLEL